MELNFDGIYLVNFDPSVGSEYLYKHFNLKPSI